MKHFWNEIWTTIHCHRLHHVHVFIEKNQPNLKFQRSWFECLPLTLSWGCGRERKSSLWCVDDLSWKVVMFQINYKSCLFSKFINLCVTSKIIACHQDISCWTIFVIHACDSVHLVHSFHSSVYWKSIWHPFILPFSQIYNSSQHWKFTTFQKIINFNFKFK